MYRIRHLLSGFAVIAMAACASVEVDPIGAGERPTDRSTDEAGLWQRMDAYEDYLKTTSAVIQDPDLNAYVQDVTCRVIGTEYCDDLRIYILDVPAFNASMAPNGLMQVYSGLLLRAENEAQLAFVLGHEFAHYRERHSLESWRDYKNRANASMVFGIAMGAAGAPAAAVAGDLALAAGLYGFSRDNEREADDVGYDLAVAAGYDAKAGAALWSSLIREVETSSSDRKRRRIARANIFSTHPLSAERVATLSAKSEGASPGDLGLERHRAAIRPFLEEWLDRDITRRDMGEHLFLLERLSKVGLDQGVLAYRRGEAYRVRRDDGDIDKARDAYALAITQSDAPVEAWRELASIYRRLGNNADAVATYRTYLDKAPAAEDRALVERYIDRLTAQTNE